MRPMVAIRQRHLAGAFIARRHLTCDVALKRRREGSAQRAKKKKCKMTRYLAPHRLYIARKSTAPGRGIKLGRIRK